MKMINKLFALLVMGAFMTACGGTPQEGANETEEEMTVEQTAVVTEADSLVSEIEQSVKEVKEATEEVASEVDDLLKDI